jgi:hypothetical protein
MEANEITPENVKKVWQESIGYCARSDSQNERIKNLLRKYDTLPLNHNVVVCKDEDTEMMEYLTKYLVLGIEQEITLFERLYDEFSELPVSEVEELTPALIIVQNILSEWKPLAAQPDVVAWMDKEFSVIYSL